MTLSCWQLGIKKNQTHEYDVAIVGAGICGLSLAYFLKKWRPQLRVGVIEAAQLGSGASGRNAGFNTAGSTHYLVNLVEKMGTQKALSYWEFKQESLRLMREELFTKIEAGQELWGSTTLYRSEKEFIRQSEVLQNLNLTGLEKVSSDSLMRQGLSGFAGALKWTQEGRVHSLKLLEGMKAWLESQGVEFLMNQSVAWGDEEGGRVRLQCARGEVRCDKVFLALNGYAGQFHEDLKDWVSPKRAQMVALDIGTRKIAGNFYDPDHKVYFRQDPDAAVGTLLVGGMRLLEEESENSDFDKTTPVIQKALQSYAEGLLGESLPVLARWSGVMGFTKEEKPYIRAVPFLSQTTFVGGFSGHGMGLAFGVAQEAVSRFLGVKTRFESILPLE